MIEVTFIAGVAGFAGKKQVQSGTTLGEFLALQMPQDDYSSMTITVNGKTATRDQVLVAGDRVVVRPSKIGGAC